MTRTCFSSGFSTSRFRRDSGAAFVGGQNDHGDRRWQRDRQGRRCRGGRRGRERDARWPQRRPAGGGRGRAQRSGRGGQRVGALRARRRHQRGRGCACGGRGDGLDGTTARCRALCGRQRHHWPGHPTRLRGVAAIGRPERQRDHVRAQALGAATGPWWRRLVRRHLVDRRQQHPQVVWSLWRVQVRR